MCAAIDSRTNEQVAIKKIGDIFANPLDARRTLREIQVTTPRLPAIRLVVKLLRGAEMHTAGDPGSNYGWPLLDAVHLLFSHAAAGLLNVRCV